MFSTLWFMWIVDWVLEPFIIGHSRIGGPYVSSLPSPTPHLTSTGIITGPIIQIIYVSHAGSPVYSLSVPRTEILNL